MGSSGAAVPWSTQPLLLVIALSAAAVLVLGLGVLLARIRSARRRQAAALARRFEGATVVAAERRAAFLGLRSRGPFQVRGNGVLVLTPEELFFSLLLPGRELSIPLTSITGVSTARSFLGKSVGRELLVVEFTGEDGTPDAAAWSVADLPRWRAALEEVR